MRVLHREILVVVVVDLDHGRVDACAQALHLGEGEELVLGHLADADLEVLLDGGQDFVRAAQPAGRRCTNLRITNTFQLNLCRFLKSNERGTDKIMVYQELYGYTEIRKSGRNNLKSGS